MRLNNVSIEKLKSLKEENRKKLQLLLKNIKEVNKKKQNKINKIKLHLFVKNTLKKYKPKPKKKKITDLIKFPEINLI